MNSIEQDKAIERLTKRVDELEKLLERAQATLSLIAAKGAEQN